MRQTTHLTYGDMSTLGAHTTNANTHTFAHTRTHTNKNTHIHTHTRTQTHTNKRTQAHRHTHTRLLVVTCHGKSIRTLIYIHVKYIPGDENPQDDLTGGDFPQISQCM